MNAYKLVTAEWSDTLRDGVEKLLSEGWQLQGGVAMCFWIETTDRDGNKTECYFAQAMVKE